MMHAGGGGVPTMAYYSYSNQNSPIAETSTKENQNPFEFPNVAIPPRLKNIGRKISQMSNDFLDEEPPKKVITSPNLEKKEIEVPGMGDEPVMCPFCNKPLPPSLFASQLTSHKHDHGSNSNRPSNLRRASSMRATSSPSPRMTPTHSLSRVPSASTPPLNPTRSQSLLDPLPVKTPENKVIEPALPSATAESFAETVKEGDVANHDAAEKMITEEDLKRWSTLSGIALPSISATPTTAQATASTSIVAPIPKSANEKKAFPLLPPPPPAASKLTKPPPSVRPSSSSSGFNFFGKASKPEEEEESDDDNVASGYTQLTGPASDSEDETPSNKGKSKKVEGGEKETTQEPVKQEEKAQENTVDLTSPKPEISDNSKEKTQETPAMSTSSDPDEVKKVLQEVLERVNDLSKTQSALLVSHSTLLTSLKIARSNLAMAEANSEMLEAQLKRASSVTPAASKGTSPRNVSGPTTTPGTPQLAAQAPRASGDHVRATTTANTTASPASAVRIPGRASMEERQRPTSLHITANELANAGGLVAPSPNSSLSTSANSNSWGFWNGGKKKVSGALSHVHVPSASSVIDAIQHPSRPGTPNPDGSAPRRSTDSIGSWIPTSPAAPYSVPISGAPQRANAQQASLSKSYNDQPSLSRSKSVMNVPGQRAVSTNSANSTVVTNAELSTLRQAYSAAVAKMDGMSKELAELKKGKVEMEAELENLSQALFEEANKMVSDERRKRAELEESFKEVKEEREALRETIKVLGGKVDEPSTAADEDMKKKDEVVNKKKVDTGHGQNEDEEEDFVPRDLDKHYAALRKSIHHVALGADQISEDDEDEENVKIPLVNEPTSSTSLGLAIPSNANRSNSVDSSSSENDDSFPSRSSKHLSMSMPSLPALAENNPWASPNTSTIIENYDSPSVSPPKINIRDATPSPHIPPGGLPDLPNDLAGEGEAPSGLGLDIDKGVIEGQKEAHEDKKEE
ncbi:uncharacterized protein L201_000980 [Kwoniella dendrophila CBS 6074]|uniref:GDP/GTP exchange factor Sec2 N-terminal domain-containing protein n=1 Tax=Kwoniella dendrophila CBS 6074 TaxID=1295534 RepID=A0AAX4JMX7_9TREE